MQPRSHFFCGIAFEMIVFREAVFPVRTAKKDRRTGKFAQVCVLCNGR